MKPYPPKPYRPAPRTFRRPRPYEGEAPAYDAPRPRYPRYEDDRPYPPRRPAPRPYEDRPAPYRPRQAWRDDDRPRRVIERPAARPAAAPAQPDTQLDERLKRVKLFLCDVDGILTDAGVFMGQGEETKRFNIRDGFGLRLLQRQGVKVGWISHRTSVATTKRADDLKIDFLHQAPGSKVEAVETILKHNGIAWEEVCYMGDDIVDLGVLKRAGVAATVGQGIAEVKAIAHFVTKAAGGHGAVREVAEMILKAQDKWAPLVEEYSA